MKAGVTITLEGREVVFVCNHCGLTIRLRARDEHPLVCPDCGRRWR
jgi:predicted RNA-binding Zn-ribbon protein involved in translation (DUF1610 family)